ncbi:MAG: adenylosuccinate lyase [Candidatus Cyclobacteriaceae bacterium M2_1C_046]
MKLDQLNAISPVDGRYRNKTAELSPYFSEFGLINYRVRIEIEYFIALCELPLPELKGFDKNKYKTIRNIYINFSERDAQEIKEIETTTNHDVKAVEYFLKGRFSQLGLKDHVEFIHFGLTSQDINNTAIPLSIKEAMEELMLPELERVIEKLELMALDWENIPMLARTHGQPASPTRLGKEISVFSERLREQVQLLTAVPHAAKFGGATGNFNAHYVAYPEQDWHAFANQFVQQSLGLKRSFPTTQIEHYDHLAAFCDSIKRINTVLIDLSRDFWQYISMEYFKQKIKDDEVGSSAMPHKVNPIDFENAEGNLGMANAILEHLSAKLPISRLQRDLTDSTVLRNVGVPLAHMLISYKSLLKGLEKVELNKSALEDDLEKNWAVVAEAIQTVLRREKYPKPYEALKELTRTNQKITKEVIHNFIDGLSVKEEIKDTLKKISPYNYTGR